MNLRSQEQEAHDLARQVDALAVEVRLPLRQGRPPALQELRAWLERAEEIATKAAVLNAHVGDDAASKALAIADRELARVRSSLAQFERVERRLAELGAAQAEFQTAIGKMVAAEFAERAGGLPESLARHPDLLKRVTALTAQAEAVSRSLRQQHAVAERLEGEIEWARKAVEAQEARAGMKKI